MAIDLSLHPGPVTPPLLTELLQDITNLYSADTFRHGFKKECTDLVRRISLLTHLFEEFKEIKVAPEPSGAPSSSSSSSSSYGCWLSDLVLSLQAAKRLLLVTASFDPDASPDGAAKKISFQFQCVTWKLERALGKIPYEQFNISEEVQEQVTLVRTQLKRATERFSPLNSKSIPHSSSQPLDGEVEQLHSGERVSGSLHTANISNLDHKTKVKPVLSVGNRSTDDDRKINDPERLVICSSATSSDGTDPDAEGNVAEKSSVSEKKQESNVFPDDLLCPISLELMKDPVIVSTGQTYERSYIQRWIDCGNKTCPKTQQKLQHVTLTPNYVLRSLISQWCTEHNYEQPAGLVNGKVKESDGSFQDVSGDMETIVQLVRKLSSRNVDEHRAAATEVRSLSKRSTGNRILLAEAGAIPVLVKLLTAEDFTTQENAVTSILNLSIYENNKRLIMLADAIPSIVQVLRAGSMETRENAAATIFSLSLADENKIIIGASGAISALVDLLQNGRTRGKKDAAMALFNLCIYQGNKGRAVRAGIITPLSKMLIDTVDCMADEALTILSVLASHPDAKVAIVKASIIPILIELIRTGQPRIKENAAAILLSLCKRDEENLGRIWRLGASIPLSELAKSGSERAKQKATSLLEHLLKLHQC